jgi:hypothetical protein
MSIPIMTTFDLPEDWVFCTKCEAPYDIKLRTVIYTGEFIDGCAVVEHILCPACGREKSN